MNRTGKQQHRGETCINRNPMKTLATLLLCLALTLVPAFSKPAMAASQKTQQEAIKWALDQSSKKVGSGECVAFAQEYLSYLGYAKITGNANKWIGKTTGDCTWIPAGSTPQPGDIFVKDAYQGGAGQYGHVGVVISVKGDKYDVVHQNWTSKKYVFRCDVTSKVAGFIRPRFTASVTQSSAKFILDGKEIAFDAWVIENYTCVRVRDLAYYLNDTSKQFSITGDAQATYFNSGERYVPDGSEPLHKGSGTAKATPLTGGKYIVNGKAVPFAINTVNGKYYYRVSELANALGIDLWAENNTIYVDTGDTQPAPVIGMTVNPSKLGPTITVQTDGDELWYALSDGKRIIAQESFKKQAYVWDFSKWNLPSGIYTFKVQSYKNGMSSELRFYEFSVSSTQTPQTQYRYQTRTKTIETTASDNPTLSGWNFVRSEYVEGSYGPWSDWKDKLDSTDKKIEIETRTVDIGTRTEIFLGRYYSSKSNKYSATPLDSSYTFEGGWIDERNVKFVGQAFAGGRSDSYQYIASDPSWYRNYYFFPVGQYGGQKQTVSLGTKTQYRYRECLAEARTIYYFERTVYGSWSAFSEWQDTPVYGSDVVNVETRIK